jgi:hypothetical protein
MTMTADAEVTRLWQKAKWPKEFTISYRTVTQPTGEACMVYVDCNNELSGSIPGPNFNAFNTDIDRVPSAAPTFRSSQAVTAMTM